MEYPNNRLLFLARGPVFSRRAVFPRLFPPTSSNGAAYVLVRNHRIMRLDERIHTGRGARMHFIPERGWKGGSSKTPLAEPHGREGIEGWIYGTIRWKAEWAFGSQDIDGPDEAKRPGGTRERAVLLSFFELNKIIYMQPCFYVNGRNPRLHSQRNQI